MRGLHLAGTQLVEVRGGSTAAALAELGDDPDVASVSRNWLRRPVAIPNDPFFDELWGLHNTGQPVGQTSPTTGTPDADIDAPEAWEIQPGWGSESESGIVVAVMDTGADLGHPELEGRLWTNVNEIPDNEIDDDGNGYVDDVHGYDFAGEDLDDPLDGDANPDDPDGHGTHVAGTVLAEGDNEEGVVGVAPGSELMTLKVCALDDEGEAACPLASMLEAYGYAVDNGARVLNGSLGGPGFSPLEVTLLGASPQTLFVFAAGNGGEDGIGDDNDSEHSYPCALDEEDGYAAENLICVAATTQKDGMASFSNFGAESVDLGAPGVRTLSTYPESLTPPEFLPYAYLSGTSMATPHVSGSAALLLAALPAITSQQAKQAILDGVDLLPALDGKTVSGGRLNVLQALVELGFEPPPSEEEEQEGGDGEGTEDDGGLPPLNETESQIITANTAAPTPLQAHDFGPRDRTRPRTFFRERPRRVVRTPWRWGKAVFRFGSNEQRVRFLCRIDRGPWRGCPARFVRWFRPGRHVLRVRARDAAGNVDRTPAVFRFVVKRRP